MSLSLENPSNYYTVTRKYDLRFPDLEGDIETDVVIIGGGFTGINTALELAERGNHDVVVLESNYLGFGGSGRNGGHVMAGIGHELETIQNDVGPDGLKAIFEITDLGSNIIKDRIARYGIDADFQHGYGYLGFNRRQAKLLQQWEKDFKSLNPDQDIEYLEGAAVQSIVGSEYYSCALKHMGNGHIHSLNLLLGEAKAFTEVYGGKIFEYTPALEVEYGNKIIVRTAKGSVKANKILWACGAFLNRLEPTLHKGTVNVYAFNTVSEPLSDELINRISPIRGAFSDVTPIIDYYRVTKENRLLYGTCGMLLEYVPTDLKGWIHKKMLRLFPYLKDIQIDMAWGGPLDCTLNLFPQVGTLPGHNNVFYVQGYSGFGVTPSQVVAKVIADGMGQGSAAWDAMKSIPIKPVYGKDNYRVLICSLGKIARQLNAFRVGRR
ncbi:FAD-binding oxidoreductase [Pseudomonas juntendi]|uniref:FAD-binding oxidoreductase n=1 Tax=Pseudomonas juntendi TaxID=2666183 RepID=A0ABD4YC09_9PSED|nr:MULTISPECIES: FAD-binding oxidoreductase [Pseudomonas]MDH0756168.1 FAD-binding oxidoreductase [Pseudomonas juntendi]MDH1919852.1 FAD-binding oxidoreductase [Pseudomonas juntendi]RRV55380.1 FAD-binding oxidoreductase [Pseudomonas sp. p99-361]SUD79739.1 putative oxidoreductase [Pseudomonas putida]